MISEGNDPTPSLLFHNLRHAPVHSMPMAGNPAAANAWSCMAPAQQSPSSTGVLHPLRSQAKFPKGAVVRTWLGVSGPILGLPERPTQRPPTSSSPACSFTEPALGSLAAGWWPAKRRRVLGRETLRARGRPTPAIRVLDRKAPSDRALVIRLHYSC